MLLDFFVEIVSFFNYKINFVSINSRFLNYG